jgi:hypothetical protein
MADSPSSLRIAADIGGAAGLAGLVLTAVLYFFSLPSPLLLLLGGVSFGAFCVGLLGKVFLSNNLSFETLGNLHRERALGDSASPTERPSPEADRVPIARQSEPSAIFGSSLEEIERHYELKKLNPNLYSTSLDPEVVAARYDQQGVIVVGFAETPNTFNAHVVPITNGGKDRVGQAKKVWAQITFRDLQESNSRTVHRGAWLSEKETEIDFPANCSPRRLVLITVEGTEPMHVFAVSRDFDSSYQGTVTMREELKGEMYKFTIRLFREGDPKYIKTFEYILQIGHLPGGPFAPTLSHAYFWQRKHLYAFGSQGHDFMTKIHGIYMEGQTEAKKASEAGSPIENFLSTARAVEEREEERMLEEIKVWETRAADFIGLHTGMEQKGKFLNAVPSIEEGFKRMRKTLAYRLSRLDAPPPLPFWTLSESISARTNQLGKLAEELKISA